MDFIVQDPAGNVIRDSKAERIADDTFAVNLLAPKLEQSANFEDSLPAIQKRWRILPMNLYICTRFATQFHVIMGTSIRRARLWELTKVIGNA